MEDLPETDLEIYYDLNKCYGFFCEFLQRPNNKVVLVAREESATILKGLTEEMKENGIECPEWLKESVVSKRVKNLEY